MTSLSLRCGTSFPVTKTIPPSPTPTCGCATGPSSSAGVVKVGFRAHAWARLVPGNHAVRHPGKGEQLLAIRQVPWRSLDQVARKYRQGAVALATSHLPPDVGRHWHEFAELADDELLAGTTGIPTVPDPRPSAPSRGGQARTAGQARLMCGARGKAWPALGKSAPGRFARGFADRRSENGGRGPSGAWAEPDAPGGRGALEGAPSPRSSLPTPTVSCSSRCGARAPYCDTSVGPAGQPAL